MQADEWSVPNPIMPGWIMSGQRAFKSASAQILPWSFWSWLGGRVVGAESDHARLDHV